MSPVAQSSNMAKPQTSKTENINIYNIYVAKPQRSSLVGKWSETACVHGKPIQIATIEIFKHTSQGVVEGKMVRVDYNIYGDKLSYITYLGVMKENA